MTSTDGTHHRLARALFAQFWSWSRGIRIMRSCSGLSPIRRPFAARDVPARSREQCAGMAYYQ